MAVLLGSIYTLQMTTFLLLLIAIGTACLFMFIICQIPSAFEFVDHDPN